MKKFLTLFFLAATAITVNAQSSCDSWVKLNDRFSAITVGDLDVTGDQITVEASFNMTGSAVDIVSKHFGGNDVNYLLRAVRGEITTTQSGFVVTDEGAFPCGDTLQLNKTYHVALVYNGSSLKFYRNGILVSEVPAYGDLVTNNWDAAIGEHAPVVTPTLNGSASPYYQNSDEGQGFYDESFRGFINEVRIWNVARSGADIKSYMNSQLPDPRNQTGLLGYWVFDSLVNKAGIGQYDGKVEGTATIGATNTTCNCIPDSCKVYLPVQYFRVAADQPVANEGVNLKWQTEGENGLTNFQIERAESALFQQYETVGSVNAVNRATGVQTYTFRDVPPAPVKPEYYYRIKINHNSTEVVRSATVRAKVITTPVVPPTQELPAAIFPNPSKDGVFTLRFNSNTTETGSLMVYSAKGERILSKNVAVVTGSNTVSIDLRSCQKGSYYVRMVTNDYKAVKSIVKL